MFEVGLDFQEELDEVFGHLAADRTLEGSPPRASMIAANCEETARPMSGGIEFDVKLAQHTAVDVLPCGDAETKHGCDGTGEVRNTRKVEW